VELARWSSPGELAWSGGYDSIAEAFTMEKQIQGWRREKREALIMGRYDLLPKLSASPDPPPEST
jgi:putative endonuclease